MTRRVIDCYICTNILIGAENRIAVSPGRHRRGLEP